MTVQPRAVPVGAEPAVAPGMRRRVTPPLAVGLGAIAVTAVIGAASPYTTSAYPSCPFHALTGLFCPGCGATRALHELAGLDVVAALGMNALFVLAVPFAVLAWGGWLLRAWRNRPRAPRRWRGAWLLWGTVTLVVVFAVVRNLPGSPLAPG